MLLSLFLSIYYYFIIFIFFTDLLFYFVYFDIYSLKGGKVVIVTAGRYAGRKAVVVKATDDGDNKKKFGHALRNYIYNYIQ